ncbi:TetR/AcrR family transcriptional regulator (plasmid) [Aliirhizobium terrae]|uniref:TetR/AcrR family transcriptional regulator n=1 Tax=Terrirhizobium terrae TaxID=2926709 RepID=UPI00257495FA|nr:TetR/AcrR family transcriptional regulator [Rhizobium sp. CC-CFT758]WJH37774.1 TetR/AcrR family transcriptional regulator [Rhizobium sp. CC-CFT758]
MKQKLEACVSKPAKQTRGRPRQFDETTALIAAMRVFWRYGYAGSSVSLLLKEMAINRASMYATFGNKETLFKKVIEQYEEEKERYMRKALDQPSARGVAEHLLQNTIDLKTDQGDPQASMSVVHSSSFGPGDISLRKFIQERGNFWRAQLIARIARAQTEGDFDPGLDARGLALTLKAATDGLLAAAGNGATEAELRNISKTFLSLWPGR